MSTRCYIGMLNDDGTVRAIYHHWDGYPEGVGKVLLNHYQNKDKINKLLDLGDMSIIGEEPIGYWSDNYTDGSKCKTYRERGERGVDAKTYSSINDYLESCLEDYTYLFRNGKWVYREFENNTLKDLGLRL